MQWDNKKIVIIRLSSLGDVLLTTPVVRSLKKALNAARVDFVCKEQFIDAVKYNPNIDRAIVYSDTKEFYDELLSNRYDAVIDLHNNLRSRKISVKLKTDLFRFTKPSLKKFLLVKFKWNLLNPPVSIVERYASSVPGLKLDSGGLELFIPEEILPRLNKDRNYVGICPGSQHFTKQYPVEYQIELCNLLIDNGFIPVLFGGKSDREICKYIADEVKGALDLSNDDKLFETAANMKLCRAVICNDSGLMHTAAALRVPVAAIFGSTVKEFGFAPYGTKSIIIENNALSCRPCSHIGKSECPKTHFECMNALTPQMVYKEFEKFYESVV